MRWLAILLMTIGFWPQITSAQERGFRLAAPAPLSETGFLKYLLPRFSLKTGIRIEIVNDTDQADARLNAEAAGILVFSGPQGNWHLETLGGERAQHVKRFEDWLTSSIGRQTIEAFEIDGNKPFAAGPRKIAAKKVISGTGRAVEGEKLANTHCGRCHVVSEKNRFNSIGSTPSFGLLRSFGDWKAKFQSFYILNPHPAFTQVEGVTEPFSDLLPPPIEPLRMTLEDIAAIVDFATTIPPTNLGAPIRHQ